jgi:hypothetical protein
MELETEIQSLRGKMAKIRDVLDSGAEDASETNGSTTKFGDAPEDEFANPLAGTASPGPAANGSAGDAAVFDS